MRSSSLIRIGILTGIAIGLGACRDAGTAPRTTDATSTATLERVDQPLVAAWGSGSGDDKEGTFQFTVDPTVGYVLYFGDHQIRLPAKVICNPSSAKYGEGEWDRPCALANRPIVFTVKYGVQDGAAVMTVQPDVRFVPTVDPLRMVTLSMHQTGRLDVTKLYNILWLNQGDWIDESKTDPTLLPWTDYSTGTVGRRLKHFSGYSVTAGRAASEESSEGASGY